MDIKLCYVINCMPHLHFKGVNYEKNGNLRLTEIWYHILNMKERITSWFNQIHN